MAELSPELIEKLSDALEKLSDKLGGSSERIKKTMDSAAESSKRQVEINRRLNSELDSLSKNSRNLNEQKKAEQRTSKVLKDETDRLFKSYREGVIGQRELAEGLISLKDTVKANTNISAEARESLLRLTAGYRKTAEAASYVESGFARVGKAGQLIDSSLGNLVRAYQNGGDAVGIASSMTKVGLGLATSAAEKAGGVVSKFGGALAGIPGPLGILGTVIGTAGAAVSAFAGMAREVIEKAFPILDAETRKLVGAFQGASQAGAVFGDGINDLLNASASAGLGVDKFTKILSEQGSNIAMSGAGMQEGARMLGRIGESMRKSGVTQGLMQLGYSVEEVTAMNAQTMAQMRAGGGGKVNEQEVAAYTAQYAKDLKTLSALTGEDVKSKDKEAKQRANTLAFNQKLAQMEPAQRTAILDSLKGMTVQEQNAFRERMVNNGSLFSEESQMYESMVDGAADKGRALYDAAMAGELTLGKTNDLNAQFSERIQTSIKNATDLGFAAEAGVPALQNLAKAMNETLQQTLKVTPESLAATTQEINKAMSDAVGDNTKALGKLVLTANELEAEMNRLVGTSGALTKFIEMLGFSAESMKNLIKDATGVSQKEEQKKANATIGEAARGGKQLERAGVVASLFGNQAGSLQGEQRRVLGMEESDLAKMAQEQQTSVDAILKAVGITGGIEEYKKLREMMYSTPQFASGGIANMPDTGGLAMLHGKEAVIPLPDELSPSKFAETMKTMTEASKAEMTSQSPADLINALSREMNNTLGQINNVDVLSKLSEQMEELLRATRDVVANTDRTARGVA